MPANHTENQLYQPQQIEDDLKGELSGDVASDPVTCSLYSTDASLHTIRPCGVVYPQNEEDVSRVVKYAAEHEIPVVARGSGTGLAGGCLGQGLIIDFSRYMNRILEIKEHSIIVEAGAILNDVNEALYPHQRYFPPDPSNASITTIGGMIGVDAAGSHAVRIGSTRDHVRSLEVVLAGGDCCWLSRESILSGMSRQNHHENEQDHTQEVRVRSILKRLSAILTEHQDMIAAHQPPLARNCCGYYLRNVLQDGVLNFPRFFVGSEGTLGICTKAELNTLAIPHACHTLLLYFNRFDAALEVVPTVLKYAPSACDLLDRRLLTLARDAFTDSEMPIPHNAESALMIEFADQDQNLVEARVEQFIQELKQNNSSYRIGSHAKTPEDSARLWLLPKRVVPLLARIQGDSRPVPLVEDIVIPPEFLSEFLTAAQRIFQRYRTTVSLYAHAGTGQLHLRPFLPAARKEDRNLYESLSRDLYHVVMEYKGSISGEHGDGLSRTAFIRSQYGPLYRIFQQIKQLFDPEGMFNPNKIISNDPHLTIKHLKVLQETEDATPVETQSSWSSLDILEETIRCNSCGHCRSHDFPMRMCPFTHSELSEESSPRAKVNLIQQLVEQKISPDQLSGQTLDRVLETCFNCKQCQWECPSQVDVPHLLLELKAQRTRDAGLDRDEWFLSRVDYWASWCVLVPWFSNVLLRTPPVRWLLERLVNLDARRQLPKFASRPFLNSVKANKPHHQVIGNRQPILMIDHYANFHQPQLIKDCIRILEELEISLIIPQDQVSSGMQRISVGDFESARALADENLKILGPYAREGHPIITLDPSTTICLKQDYPFLIDHPDVGDVARQTVEIGDFLFSHHHHALEQFSWKPLNYRALYHPPCHLKALGKGVPSFQLVRLIPELDTELIDPGCCGMGGTYGLTKSHREKSLQMGERTAQACQQTPHDFIMSESPSCGMQLAEFSNSLVMHPLSVLAAGMGFSQELVDRLSH